MNNPLIKSIIVFDFLMILIKRFKNIKGLKKMVLNRKIKIFQFKNGKSIKFGVNLMKSLFIIFPFPVLGIIIISFPSSINELSSLAAQVSDFPKGKKDEM